MAGRVGRIAHHDRQGIRSVIADWEMTEAAWLVERACGLMEPHAHIPALAFVVRTLRQDVRVIHAIARNTRERDRFSQKALFA